MPTMIRAAESTGNVGSDRNKRDVAEMIHYLNPEAAPFTPFITDGLSRKSKRVAYNPKFEWKEKGDAPKSDAVNGTATTGETTITVDNSEYFGVYDIVKVTPTAEQFRVTAVTTASDTLTVTRAYGSTTAATIGDNADLLIIGNAKSEGADKGSPRSFLESTVYNYSQIFEYVFSQTGTQSATKTYIDAGGDARLQLRKDKAKELRIDMERAFLFGERYEADGSGNTPTRTSGGLTYWLTSNGKAAGAVLTAPEMEDFLQDIFQYTGGSNSRLLLASPTLVSVLDQLAAGRLQVAPKEDTYGVAIKNWVTGHGNLTIVKHHLLTGDYDGYGFALDTSKVKYVHMDGRDVKLERDVQTPGADRWEDLWRAEVGLMVMNPETGGVLTGAVA